LLNKAVVLPLEDRHPTWQERKFSEKSTHLPCSLQMAILILALTEKDEALKGGRAALTLKRRRDTSHMKKRKRYMQRPSEAALTGKTAGRQPEKCKRL
jgi:hypothetical protein